jgi:hypothetical protein
MKILLHKAIVFSKDLDYRQACAALKAASESLASDHIRFFIQSGQGKWSLCGYVRFLNAAFLANPENFLIEV